MKQEAYRVADYKTKTAMWQHLEPRVKALNQQSPEPVHVAHTLGDVIKKYVEQKLPQLVRSTRDTQIGQFRNHIEPKWGRRFLRRFNQATSRTGSRQ